MAAAASSIYKNLKPARLSQYLDRYIAPSYNKLSANNRFANVADGSRIKPKYAYNPQFISMIPGHHKDTDEIVHFHGDFEEYAVLLDMTVLRVHRRFNQIEYRKTGRNLLTVSTSMPRKAHNFVPEVTPFLFEPEFYDDKPHPYDAEGAVPGYFIGGCMYIMEQLLEKIWGANMYEGLTTERDFLYEKFLRVVHHYGVMPGDVDKCFEIMEVREQLEALLLMNVTHEPLKCISAILAENPSWVYSKGLQKIYQEADKSPDGLKKLKEDVKEYLKSVFKDCLENTHEQRMHEIGVEMFKFKVHPGAKRAYETALLDVVRQEWRTLPDSHAEDLPDMASWLTLHPRIKKDEGKVDIGQGRNLGITFGMPRKRYTFRKLRTKMDDILESEEEDRLKFEYKKMKSTMWEYPPGPEEKDKFPDLGLNDYLKNKDDEEEEEDGA